jgi:hypothetical protein
LRLGGINPRSVYSQPNPNLYSPATGKWQLHFAATDFAGNFATWPIVFEPTGDIDRLLSSLPNLDDIANLLSQPLGGPVFSDTWFRIWRLFNWVFVSQYWLTLYDIGQTTPATYVFDGSLVQTTQPNFSRPLLYNETYNIFVNDTLYKIYSSFLRDEIFNVSKSFVAYRNATFLPLNDTNRLKPENTTFYRNYSCVARKRKGWFSLCISVFAADYAVIGGVYTIFIFVAGHVQRRKESSIPRLLCI